MIVQKFGGTSVGSAKRIENVAQIISESSGEKFVVISAMSGFTNKLYSVIVLLHSGDIHGVVDELMVLKKIFYSIIEQLMNDWHYRQKSFDFIKIKFQEIEIKIQNDDLKNIDNQIIALGEICTSFILSSYLESVGKSNIFLYAPEFLIKDSNNEPKMEISELLLEKILSCRPKIQLIITQGFICSDTNGELSNFGRGGSDYSATIIGSLLNAEEIQIWSDQEGIMNNDPRYVENTYLLKQLSYTEAEELAYFGAKILHPQSIYPAKSKGIKISVKNTFNPSGSGTQITSLSQENGIKAVAAKDNISIVRIKSVKMMNAFGFLKRIFQVFEDFRTPVDVITTSEVSVSVTIDNDSEVEEITDKLKEFADVEIENKQSIICLVGDFDYSKSGVVATILNAIKDIPLKMISQGASNHNMTFVIDTIYRTQILKLINQQIFNTNR